MLNSGKGLRLEADKLSEECQAVLRFICAAYRANPEAEVSELVLRKELGLEERVVRPCLTQLVRLDLIEADLFLVNLWARATELGLAATEKRSGSDA